MRPVIRGRVPFSRSDDERAQVGGLHAGRVAQFAGDVRIGLQVATGLFQRVHAGEAQQIGEGEVAMDVGREFGVGGTVEVDTTADGSIVGLGAQALHQHLAQGVPGCEFQGHFAAHRVESGAGDGLLQAAIAQGHTGGKGGAITVERADVMHGDVGVAAQVVAGHVGAMGASLALPLAP